MLWLPLCPHLALFFFMALIPIWDHITNLFLYLFVFCLPIKICHRTQKGRDLITYSLLFVTYSLLFPQGLLRWLMYNRHFMQIDNFDFSFTLHTFAFSYYFAFHQQKQMIYNKCPAEQFRNFIINIFPSSIFSLPWWVALVKDRVELIRAWNPEHVDVAMLYLQIWCWGQGWGWGGGEVWVEILSTRACMVGALRQVFGKLPSFTCWGRD